MPTKRVVKQKQKQRQSVTVNVNVAKARSKSSAKKSGKKGSGRGSVMMLPPPIYTSPIDRLTPAMYGSQGQQIQQKSMEDLLKNFLSNQQNQQTNTGFKSLGGEPQLRSTSEFIPYDDSSDKSFKSLGSAPPPGSSSVSYNPSSEISRPLLDDEYYAINPLTGKKQRYVNPMSDNISEMTDPSYMSDPFSRSSQYSLASPFSADSLDYESTAPKFSQDEARVSQGNIYESLKQNDPALNDRSSKHFYDLLNRMEEKTQKEIDTLTPQIPEPFRRPDKRPPIRLQIDDDESILTGTPASQVNIIPFEDEMSSDSLSNFSGDSLNTNPFPKNIFNKMMGFN